MTKKLALIDSYGFVFRAYHSLPPLTRQDGTPVGAVYGFTNMLIRLLASLNVSHVGAVFDSGSKTFRNDIYSAYKANRPPCPEDLKPQFPLIREAAEALNLPILEKVGYEADDLIATIAKQAAKDGYEVVIISSDKDLMQLVDDRITMFDAMKNKIIDAAAVEEKFLVPPTQVLDVLSLMGDASDNVPGVRGIGPKIAAELISHYGTLENLLENIHEIKQNKRRETLQDGVEQAKLSKILITLCETVPIKSTLDDYEVQNINPHKLINFLQEQGFRALISRIKKEFNVKEEPVLTQDLFSPTAANDQINNKSTNQEATKATAKSFKNQKSFEEISKIIVSDVSQLAKFVTNTIESGNLTIDIESNFENNQLINAFILSCNNDSEMPLEILYVPVSANKSANLTVDLFSSDKEAQDDLVKLDVDLVKEYLLPLLQDSSIKKISYNAKNIIKFFTHNSNVIASIDDFDDVALMSYVLNSGNNKSDLDVLVANYLQDEVGDEFSPFCQKLEKNKIPDEFSDFDKKTSFYFFKNYVTQKLHDILKQNIFNEKLNNVYYCFDRPLIKVLAQIEQNGIAINQAKLKNLSSEFGTEINKLTLEIHSLAGEDFNIASPKQMGHVLFEKLGIETKKKSKKTGAFSTNSDVLEELDLQGHIIARKILQWRHFSKLKSTYCDALQVAVSQETGRIHTTFSNISTTTGRLSSINPNLQNIPIRTTHGNKIRNAFIASKGHKLISADYSQIELRVLASIARIDTLKQAFRENKDIHTITAAQVFGIGENEVGSDERRKAKAINFGIIYGISAFGLAKQLKIERSDAQNYIENYFVKYPGIKGYMENTQEFARENGFVETIIGRKCFIPAINSKNHLLKGLAERLAINAPIQGSAADIIKKAMIDFRNILLEKNFESKIILQIHDELIVEAPESEVEEVSQALQETMAKALLLDGVPLKVDLKINDFWG